LRIYLLLRKSKLLRLFPRTGSNRKHTTVIPSSRGETFFFYRMFAAQTGSQIGGAY